MAEPLCCSGNKEMIVIGAGISGLSLAHYAVRAGLTPLVLEQDQRPGGCIHSHRFAGERAGFWLELGAHSAFNSYTELLALLERISPLHRLLQRREKVRFFLYADQAMHRIAAQLSFTELLSAPFRAWGLSRTGRTVADYYGQIAGPRNYVAVLEPAFNAVICQPSGAFPADSLFNPRRRRKDVPRSFTLPGGLQTVTDLLAQQPRIRLQLGQRVLDLQRDRCEFLVHTAQGDYRTRILGLAVPVATAAKLLCTVAPEVAEQLAEIEMATVETVGVVLPRARVSLPPIAGLIGRDQPFYSVVSRDTVPDERYRGFTFHFRPGILDAEGQRQCIAQTLRLPPEALTQDSVVSKINNLPALRIGHRERIRRIDRVLAGMRLALTGNYFTGVALEDCVVRSQNEVQRLVT